MTTLVSTCELLPGRFVNPSASALARFTLIRFCPANCVGVIPVGMLKDSDPTAGSEFTRDSFFEASRIMESRTSLYSNGSVTETVLPRTCAPNVFPKMSLVPTSASMLTVIGSVN